ncbi:MAG TPA: hypothetical protein HPP83_05195 [Candidatus Hydrogenedentes bacterium]|nr:hypothetical protein [Candidatus Hydrogenedentota bacterium]
MSRYRFPASLPRKMYWSDEVNGCAVCPDCGAPLESEHHTYVIATRTDGYTDSYLIGNDGGHFCGECPVVVLDHDQFERFAAMAAGTAKGVDYIVMGLVDLGAVPEDKRKVPLGDDANPLPLVKFANFGEKKPQAKSTSKNANKRKRKNRKRKRR